MRDTMLETCSMHISFQSTGASSMRLSYLVAPPPHPCLLVAPVQPSTWMPPPCPCRSRPREGLERTCPTGSSSAHHRQRVGYRLLVIGWALCYPDRSLTWSGGKARRPWSWVWSPQHQAPPMGARLLPRSWATPIALCHHPPHRYLPRAAKRVSSSRWSTVSSGGGCCISRLPHVALSPPTWWVSASSAYRRTTLPWNAPVSPLSLVPP
jgi:hypothetical protein